MPIQMKTIQEIFFSEKGHLKNENAILFIYLFIYFQVLTSLILFSWHFLIYIQIMKIVN